MSSYAARIEVVLGSVASHPTVAPMLTANLTKGLFQDGRLLLQQFPGWYVPEVASFEALARIGAASTAVLQGDRFYAFTGKIEAYRTHEIHQVLSLLPHPVTIRDYCYIGGAGTPLTDSDGNYYVTRIGRLTLRPPQNPGKVEGDRPVYFEVSEFRFEGL